MSDQTQSSRLFNSFQSLEVVLTLPWQAIVSDEFFYQGGYPPPEQALERLQQAGYNTGYVGKWHLNGPKTPLEAGFDFASWCWSNEAEAAAWPARSASARTRSRTIDSVPMG